MREDSPSARQTTSTVSHSDFLVSETRLERLIRTGEATPRFLQGVYPVPPNKTAEVLYFRGGNLSADGAPVRYFPVGPKADFHVPLAIVEPHPADTRLEVGLAAPRGLAGTVVVDVGIVEVGD
jgi:assimilatory nitrate reductase catalytic subunit